MSGQRLFYPPNVAGWDDTRWLDTATFRGRWYAVQRILRDHSARPAEGEASRTTRKQLVDRALDFWNDPPLSDGDARTRSARSRTAHSRDAGNDELEAAAVPGARAERAPPADRHVPRPPDCMTTAAASATSAPAPTCFVRRAGRGLPAIEPGMPLPAGTGLTRRASSRARSASRSPCTAPGRLAAVRRRDRRAPPPAQRTADARHRVPAGRRRRALAALSAAATRSIRSCRPTLAVTRGHRVHRGRTAASGIRRSRRSPSSTPRAR